MSEMDVQGLVGWNVARLRKRLKISQSELAQNTGTVDQSYISGLENGKRNPTAVILTSLSTALDVQVGELFSMIGAPKGMIEGYVELKRERSKRHSSEQTGTGVERAECDATKGGKSK
jgi:transcriptional regulator with XRE-family HTH domain